MAVVEAARVTLAKIENYFKEYGAIHEPDMDANGDPHECPEDDTCECPLVVELNAALKVEQQALAAFDAKEGKP